MKKSRSSLFIPLLLLVLVAVYFGAQVYRYFSDPFSTTLTYRATSEDTLALDGYLVWQEDVLPSLDGTLHRMFSDGEKVGIGQTIAVSYQSSDALSVVSKIEERELRLEQLEFALSSYLNPDAALKLDSAISTGLLELRSEISHGDYAAVESDLSSLKSDILKRSHTYASGDEIQANISAVQSEIASLRRQLSVSGTVRASVSGIYADECDGYEGVLTPEMLSDLTPSKLNGIQPSDKKSNLGKLIRGTTWYYASTVSEEDAARIKKGQVLTLRFSKGLDRDVDVTVSYVSPAENGRVAVVFSANKYLSLMTSLRHQTAEIVFRTYTGLRIPVGALRLDEQGRSGVYCVMGVTARYKPVEIVCREEGFLLVRPAEEATGAVILRPGDEIILAASALSDGKYVG